MKAHDVESLVSPIAEACGLELDRLDIQKAGRRTLVRIYLDGDGSSGLGPSLDEIAVATKAISSALDDSPVVGSQPYTLEVSSRGVGRPLVEPKHYRRNMGRLVALTMNGEEVTGRIMAVTDDEVTLDVDGVHQAVPLARITRAVVQVELNRVVDEDEES